MESPPIVVSATWLKDALQAGYKDLVVLDTTWAPQYPSLPQTTGQALYEGKHIPSALYFDLDAGVTKTKLIPRNLPEPSVFQEYVRSLGIGEHSHVVCYDRDDGVMTSAAGPRACFIFKLYGHDAVSVLDGGLVRWEAEGYPTESGPTPTPVVGDFVVSFRKELIVEFAAMCEVEAAGDTQIVDTRLPVNFNGQEPEPSLFTQIVLTDGKFPIPREDEIAIGHMRKAVNISFLDFFGEDKISFKSKEELKKLFSETGVDLARPAVVSCYIGHTAAMCSVLASFCGQRNFRVYYGSHWWSRESRIGGVPTFIQFCSACIWEISFARHQYTQLQTFKRLVTDINTNSYLIYITGSIQEPREDGKPHAGEEIVSWDFGSVQIKRRLVAGHLDKYMQ